MGALDPLDYAPPGLPEYLRTGSAAISASQPLVVIANERYDGADARFTGFAVTYSAFGSGSGSTAISFSQVTSRYYGHSGGVQVQNTRSSTTTVTAVFSAQDRDGVTVTATVDPEASCSWFAPDVPGVGPGWNGSVRVTASQPLVGIATNAIRMDLDPGYSIYGDSFVCYESANRN